MKLYEIEYTKRAKKQIKEFPRDTQIAVMTAIHSFEQNPRPHGYEPVKERRGVYRMRVGNYRIFYTIDDKKVTVIVVSVMHRREAYKRISRLKF